MEVNDKRRKEDNDLQKREEGEICEREGIAGEECDDGSSNGRLVDEDENEKEIDRYLVKKESSKMRIDKHEVGQKNVR